MTQSVTCPKCGSSVTGGTDFGMVACNKCGEFIMIGASENLDAIKAAVGPDHKPIEFEMNLTDEGGKPALALVPDLPPDLPIDPNALKTTVLDVNFDQLHKTEILAKTVGLDGADEGSPHDMPSGSMSPMPSMSRDSAPVDFSSPLDPIIEPPKEEIKPPSASPAFNDIVDFANEQHPSTGTGGLVYNLQISGIDSAESRQELSSCLEDKRLQIDVGAVMAGIQSGVINLPNLNPVKAAVIVNNLKRLPFQIVWSSKQLIKSTVVLALLIAGLNTFIPSKSPADTWARHEVNLKGYATRIENMQDDLRALIKKKDLEKDPKVRDSLLAEIIKKNQELHRTYDDFKKEKEHVRFEHPEQGDETERKYRHVKLKSLDELEDEAGVDGQLSRLKKKVETTYPEGKAEDIK